MPTSAFRGGEDVLTPNIDAIARRGVIFENGYVTASVCGPSRAGLLTGRYQQRFGSEDNPAPYKRTDEVLIGVSPDVPLLSELLSDRGYATGVFGKWHLGGERGEQRLMPLQRGFERFYGFLEGAALYFDPDNSEQKFMRGNTAVAGEARYFTDAIGDEALAFIDDNKDRPFFLYLPFSAVHAPMQATRDDLARFQHVADPLRRKLLAMLYAMDRNIGRVVDRLEQHDLSRHSMIVFVSDNGGHPADNGSVNAPLRGIKGQYYEGGIKVPYLIAWSGRIPHGRFTQPVSTLDIVPTVLNAVGLHRENVDGVGLLPFVHGDRYAPPHDFLYWKRVDKRAIRDARWKLVQHGADIELYDLNDDPIESVNLFSAHPDVVERLEREWRRWDTHNIPARYGFDPAVFPVLHPRSRREAFER